MLFSNERKHNVTLPAQSPDGNRPNISYLLQYLVENIMKDDRKELFILEDNVYVLMRFNDMIITNNMIDDQAFLSLSMTPIGNWRAKISTSCSRVTTSSSFLPCTVVDMLGQPWSGP